MELKHKKQTVIAVDYRDLEDFIQAQYGHRIEIPAALESGNDTTHEIQVNGKHFDLDLSAQKLPYDECFVDGLDDYDQNDVDGFRETGSYSYGTPDSLLNDLCARKLIEPGSYLISVSW